MTRLSQMYSEYSQLTSRSKRINYLKTMLQEKDVHGAVTGDQESDSDSSVENLGDVTQFGLTGALANMANLTFMAGAPEIIQEAEKQMGHGPSEGDEQLSKGDQGVLPEVSALRGILQQVKPVLSSPDGGETSGESPQAQTDGQVHAPPDDDTQDTDDEADIMAAAASRGRRSAVVAPRPSQKRKASVDKRTPP